MSSEINRDHQVSTEPCGNSLAHFANGGEVPSLPDLLAEAERRGAVKALRAVAKAVGGGKAASLWNRWADAIENVD